MSTETERQERLTADRERRRQLRASADRSALRHAGFKLDPSRTETTACGHDASHTLSAGGCCWTCYLAGHWHPAGEGER